MIRRNLSIILSLLSLCVIVAVFMLSYRRSVTLIDSFHRAEQSHFNLVRLNELESLLKDIQRAHRGYVISHHRESLRPLEEARVKVPGLINDLASIYKDEPVQAVLLDSIELAFERKITYVAEAVDMVGRGSYDSAMNGMDQGRALLNAALALVARVSEAEQQIYQVEKSTIESDARTNLIFITTGLIMSTTLLALAAGWAYKRQITRLSRELDTANLELEATNAALLEANLELRKSNHSLEKLNRELNDFSYSVSHDLKAPLRAIRGFCEMLVDETDAQTNQRISRAAGVIEHNARRMDALINDLLKLARLGNTPVARHDVNMNELVNEVLHDQPPASGVQLKVATMEPAKGDAGLLKQVWENLISNAIKFSAGSNPPAIEIGYRRNNTEQHFWVRDNGVGFDAQYSDKLFKVFSRLHSKNEFEGTGAGLAIVKKIIDAHGGRTWAESTPDKGAVFYFSLPVNDRVHDHA